MYQYEWHLLILILNNQSLGFDYLMVNLHILKKYLRYKKIDCVFFIWFWKMCFIHEYPPTKISIFKINILKKAINLTVFILWNLVSLVSVYIVVRHCYDSFKEFKYNPIDDDRFMILKNRFEELT